VLSPLGAAVGVLGAVFGASASIVVRKLRTGSCCWRSGS